jgi:hypothetical protein
MHGAGIWLVNFWQNLVTEGNTRWVYCDSPPLNHRKPDVLFQITQSIAFAFILFFISSLPTLPLSVYSTFVLEEKHGFNKTTPTLFITDTLKGGPECFVSLSPLLLTLK